MTGRTPSSRVRADHIRELARAASDARTQHILIDMARELEAQAGEAEAPAPQPFPRSLS